MTRDELSTRYDELHDEQKDIDGQLEDLDACIKALQSVEDRLTYWMPDEARTPLLDLWGVIYGRQTALRNRRKEICLQKADVLDEMEGGADDDA